MPPRILVPIDGSARSDRAVKAAAGFVRHGGSLVLFHAVPGYRSPVFAHGYSFDWPSEKHYLKESAAEGAKMLAAAKRIADRLKVPATTMQARSDRPADAILAAAKKSKATMIAMASHGRRGFERLMIGSETQKVLSHTSLPVVVVR